MRSPIFLLLTTLAVAPVCKKAPEPEKATDRDKIQPKDGEGELGPIPTGAIAKVGTVEIPAEKFREIYDLKVKKYSDRGKEIPKSADRRYRKSIAERLIYHEVLRQEAAALSIEYDAADLEERQSQQKRGVRDWQKHLDRRGETEVSLRDIYVAELREKAILDKLGKLSVSQEEIDADYEKIRDNWKSDKPRRRAAHILIPVGPEGAKGAAGHPEAKDEGTAEEKAKWEAEAKAKANEVYKLATAPNADFSSLAREHSSGPSALKGGDIGIFTRDRMAKEFSDAAFGMKVGDISKPVRTNFGYHIIKLTGKWPEGELPKEALEEQIVNRLKNRKLHQGRRELKEQLLAKYQVEDLIKATLGPEPNRPEVRSNAQNDARPGHPRRAAPEGHDDGEPAGGNADQANANAPANGDPAERSPE
jgi:parvulin-like peptidyl-prolyl isomerase